MTDDLVTRLRTRGCWLCHGDCAAANPPVMHCPVKEDNAAADEIERLTAQMRTMLVGAQAFEKRAERAEVERDALRADAERYRWLKANARRLDFAGLSWTQGCELDARVDASLRERRG